MKDFQVLQEGRLTPVLGRHGVWNLVSWGMTPRLQAADRKAALTCDEASLAREGESSAVVNPGQMFPLPRTDISHWPQLKTKLNTGESAALTSEAGKREERGTRQAQEYRPRWRKRNTE